MRSLFLIVAASLLLSGNLLTGQTVSDSDIRKLYFNLDTIGGDKLLALKYDEGNPQYFKMIGYRGFLHVLLNQSKINSDIYFLQSGQWLRQLEKLHSDGSSEAETIAEIHLYRALVSGYFSDYKTLAAELFACYKLVARDGPGFPSSELNKLSGIIGVLLQQVPDQYIKYLKVIGIRPSGLSGYNGLERYYSAALPGSFERMEGYLLLITAYKEFSEDPTAAWRFAKSEGKPMLNNPVIRYQSALAALKAGDCESAINLLDPKVNGQVQPAFPYWNFQLGRCKLYRNDVDAKVYLEKFLEDSGGDNYLHTALLMDGWNYQINNQLTKAADCFSRIKALPEPVTPYDKQALREVVATRVPDSGLLQARLLFDGGYYEKCLATIAGLIGSGVYGAKESGELLYRKARCEQRLNLTLQAIQSFLGVIARVEEIQSYIVPNAALQVGHLYKKSGQVDLARKFYQVCLDLNNYGYREGINRQAQLALKELGR